MLENKILFKYIMSYNNKSFTRELVQIQPTNLGNGKFSFKNGVPQIIFDIPQMPKIMNGKSLRIQGNETFDFKGLTKGKLQPGSDVEVVLTSSTGAKNTFIAQARIDTPVELDYFQNGGILQFVLRRLATNPTP